MYIFLLLKKGWLRVCMFMSERERGKINPQSLQIYIYVWNRHFTTSPVTITSCHRRMFQANLRFKVQHHSVLSSLNFSPAPPEFLIPVSDVACESGDSVTLRCKVCGWPRATITWRGPDNSTLSNNGHYCITYRWQHYLYLDLIR